MKVKTLQANNLEELEKKIVISLQNDFQPTLALVFASFTQNLEGISNFLDARQIQVVGLTTSGEIEDVGSYEDSIVVMLLAIPQPYFRLIFEEVIDNNLAKTTQSIAEQSQGIFSKPSMVVFSGGLGLDGQQVVDGIKQYLKEEIPLFGGLAGDNLQMQNTYVFTNHKKSNQALIALIFDQDKVEIKGISTSGWVAVGTEKIITKSEGNVVFTIDDQPALDVFAKNFGLDKDHIDVASEIGARFPLQLIRKDGSTVLRAPLFANAENKSLIFAGSVPQGSVVKFSVAPDFDIIEKAVQHIKDFKETIPQADALVMVSCAARKISFGPMVDDEIEGIQKIWDAPLAGFFAYGEIGKKMNAPCDFHNETISLIVLKEK